MEDELLKVEDQYYILATSSRTDDRTRVLKEGETFAVFDRFGDVQPVGLGEQGLYHEGTRFLSRLELRVGGRRPLLLSSTVKEQNDSLTVDLTNPDIPTDDGAIRLRRGSVHLFRSKFLWQGACYERLRVSNYGLEPVETEVSLLFDADYADIFEVRGSRRERRGERVEEAVDGQEVTLGYRGLDGKTRRTRIVLSPRPAALSARRATMAVSLAPRETVTLYLTVACEIDEAERPLASNDESWSQLQAELSALHYHEPSIRSTNTHLNAWLARSFSDLHMMTTATAQGPYPYAGVPWFSTAFGRDGIITALELLWLTPELARGVLTFLAATQATDYDDRHDAQPGKILHEARGGEMAALGEVPFGRYYGSVDSTPLFVMLAGAYLQRTGDLAFIRGLWPQIELAMRWIEGDGDPDQDGFLEYARRSVKGLVQQGWKDSHDSVFHEDGVMADAPIALCEVQAYAYGARRAASSMAAALGREQEAIAHARAARKLKPRFEQSFWLEDVGTYALALDGQKRPCRVRTSNAGHALYTGIASRTHARLVAQSLFHDGLFSGWGIRTLATREARYNPMSYHNGSVWPHDNALIAAGLARYGFRDLVARLFDALFDASLFFDLHRIPELFCGFPRRSGEGPTLYPVACAPQAWAAASVFMLLQASLGIRIDGHKREVSFVQPVLPESIPELRIANLRVGEASLDLLLENHPHDVGVTVLKREGEVRVVVAK